jgi:hypothetical protein
MRIRYQTHYMSEPRNAVLQREYDDQIVVAYVALDWSTMTKVFRFWRFVQRRDITLLEVISA